METRRTVTVLFVDVTGSTPLGERLDPEAIRRIFSRYFGEVAAIVTRHGGTLEKFAGDALVAVFGIRSCTRTTRSAPSGQPPRRARRSRSSTTSSCATTGSA